jgi:hypothetical protein
VATRSLNAWRFQEYSRGFSSQRERHICTPSLERQEIYECAAHGWNITCFSGETIMEASCLASLLPAQPTHFVATRDQITIVHCVMQVTGRTLLLPMPYSPALSSGFFVAHCPPMSHPQYPSPLLACLDGSPASVTVGSPFARPQLLHWNGYVRTCSLL